MQDLSYKLLLDYAQIIIGKFKFNIDTFDVVDAMTSIMTLEDHICKRKGIHMFLLLENVSVVKYGTQIAIKHLNKMNQPIDSSLVNGDLQRFK